MQKKQDSGLSCFMIVMKFHGIPITKEQAENLSVLDPEQKTGEIEIIQSAKALKMRAKLCKLKLNKLKDVKSPNIAALCIISVLNLSAIFLACSFEIFRFPS